MDENKIKSITEWPTPKAIHDVRAFNGLSQFYRTFMDMYSEIVTPLTNLTKKDCKWRWTEKHDAAFSELKRIVSNEPVLSLPDFDKAFEVHIDASDVAIGGVLVQEGHPIAYKSRKLLDRERRYPWPVLTSRQNTSLERKMW